MSHLDKIILNKKSEVKSLREKYTLADFEKGPFFHHTPESLSAALKNGTSTGIIAEFKRRSPSKGVINNTSGVAEVTSGYSANGASGLSVLTDNLFFGGSAEDLITAHKINQIPILRKDFIIDEYQVLESKAIGADLILLIAEALTANEIKKLSKLARSLGMEVLLELHSEHELPKIDQSVSIIGVNNRDLTTFRVDVNVSLRMADLLPAEMVRISESGISEPATLTILKEAGYKGFLVGEHFMATPDPVKAFIDFTAKIPRS